MSSLISKHSMSLALLVLACLFGRPALAVTAGEADGWCQLREDEGKMRLCTAYLDAVLKGLASDDSALNGTGVRLCYPADASLIPVADDLHTYLVQHPDARSKSLLDAAAAALQGRYPCK